MGCQQSVPAEIGSSFDKVSKDSKTLESESKGIFQEKLVQGNSGSPPGSVRTAKTTASLSQASFALDEDPSYLLPKVDYNGHLITEEIVRRTSSSIQCSTLVIEGRSGIFELEYAYRSQRGYNPEEPLKANQEKYGITLNFASEGGGAMMGIFSGHGNRGRECAHYTRKVLPQQLEKFIRQNRVQRYKTILQDQGSTQKGAWNPKMWPMLSDQEYKECCRRAFHETNTMMHQETTLDSEYSGASVATICLHGDKLFICNTGDCSVILGRQSSSVSPTSHNTSFDGEEEKSEIEDYIGYAESIENSESSSRIAVPLTEDHTVRSDEEQERIKLAGGDIKDCTQIVETNILYSDASQTKSIRVFPPGNSEDFTKFTRSIGDYAFEEIGVSCEPHIVSRDVTERDDILVLASNGVMEFLSDQEVIDICAASSSPLTASENVTKAAYDRWIERKNRYEDITVIVGFLSKKNDVTESNWSPQIPECSAEMHVMVDVAEE